MSSLLAEDQGEFFWRIYVFKEGKYFRLDVPVAARYPEELFFCSEIPSAYYFLSPALPPVH